MTPMLSTDELEIWIRKPIPDKLADFAQAVVEAASLVVADAAGGQIWLTDVFEGVVPPRAKLIATMLAKRSFLNPDSVVAEGGIGPIGGDRYVEEMAKFLTLTSQEQVELEDLGPGEAESDFGGLYVISTSNRPGMGLDDTIYLPDLDELADRWPALSWRDPVLGGML